MLSNIPRHSPTEGWLAIGTRIAAAAASSEPAYYSRHRYRRSRNRANSKYCVFLSRRQVCGIYASKDYGAVARVLIDRSTGGFGKDWQVNVRRNLT